MIAIIRELDGTETRVTHRDMPTSLDYQMTAQRYHDAERLAAMRRAGLKPAVNSDGSPVRGKRGEIVLDAPRPSDVRKALGLL